MPNNENEKSSSFQPLFNRHSPSVSSSSIRPEAKQTINLINQLEQLLTQAKHLVENGTLSPDYRQKLVDTIAIKTAELSLVKTRFEDKKIELLQDGSYYQYPPP